MTTRSSPTRYWSESSHCRSNNVSRNFALRTMETRNATTESFPRLICAKVLPTRHCGKAKGSIDGDWHRIIAILLAV
jgi:hypothetical protein